MSSLVLARKYRPRRFADMVGQPHVVQALTNALGAGRLHHAWLFTGTRGVGKTTVSRILAKALNCTGVDGQGGITAEPCGQCASCRDIDADRFVDYVEMDAASNRGIDDIRDLLERANYKPAVGRFKVYMIDEVHQLTKESFNALLKTLEEPPDYLKFVLATTDPQKVPVTVLSRCLQFGLRPMAPSIVRDHLSRVLQAEGVAAEPAALALLARAARGSMRDALSLTDQALAFGGGSVTAAGVRAMLGVVHDHLAYELIEALARGDGRAVVDACDALRREGGSAASVLEDMAAVLQRMAVLQLAPPPTTAATAPVDGLDGGGSGEADDGLQPSDRLGRLAQQMPPDETQLLYSLCLQGRAELGLAPDEYAGLTMVLLRLLAFRPAGSTEKKSLNPVAEPPSGDGGTPVRRPPGDMDRDLAGMPAAPVADGSADCPVMPARGAVSGPGLQPPLAEDKRPASSPVADAASASAGSNGWRLPVRDLVREVPAAQVSAASGGSSPQDTGSVVPIALRDWPQTGTEEPTGHTASGLRLRVTPEGDFWAGCVAALMKTGAITALTRELALQAQLIARDDTQWLLRVEKATLVSQRERLEAAIRGAGHPVALAVEVGPVHDSPQLRLSAEHDRQRQVALALLTGGELYRRLQREYRATILPETLRIEPCSKESTSDESR